MYRFIESIRYENGKIPLLAGHEKRFFLTQRMAFGTVLYNNLVDIIQSSAEQISLKENTKYKCRIVYDEKGWEINFTPYIQSTITSLHIKIDDKIDYSYKFENRHQIDNLKKNIASNADILIVKNRLLTDTSYANIALYDGIRWFTPKYALLEGVQRSFLLKEGIIYPKDIFIKDLPKFEKIKLFNALIDWHEAWTIDIANILL